MSLEQQNAEESDYLQEPGFTANEIKPQGFFSGLTPMTPVKGAGSGILETGSVLAEGIGAFLARAPAKGSINPVGIGLSDEAVKPWEKNVDEVSSEVSNIARGAAKDLMPDPRTTGTAGNLVFGASKVLTEAGLMTAATGSPVTGALGLGAVQGVSRYRDLLDEGVDPETARKAALVEGGAATAGMLAPVGLPAAWVADMAPAARLMTQLATGAASNVGQGVAQRYATHKILADAGFQDVADQSRSLDGEAILSDALTGAGFGGMHFLHQRPEFAEQARALAENDGALRDAARVVQDSHEVNDRAPGVPVNAQSAAVHREALEKALGDLLRDEPVDVSAVIPHEEPEPTQLFYHGSRHEFSEFDLAHLGTGEGAQAYGHGIYLAEHPEVGASYAEAGIRNLSKRDLLDYYKPGETRDMANGIKDKIVSYDPESRTVTALRTEPGFPKPYEVSYSDMGADVFRVRKALGQPLKTPGNVYKAQIPTKAVGRMIASDKPVSEQPENVKQAFKELGVWDETDKRLEKGQDLYAKLSYKLGGGQLDDGAASAALREKGVPGIHYLDQMSRTEGRGTRNLVLFDEKLANITHRNEIAFARQPERTLDARQMLRDEFERAGVFDEGAKLDEMMRAMEERYEPTITPRERETLTMPDEEGNPRNADDILAEIKEQGEKAKEDEPLFKLAAECAGRVA